MKAYREAGVDPRFQPRSWCDAHVRGQTIANGLEDPCTVKVEDAGANWNVRVCPVGNPAGEITELVPK